MLSLGGTGDKAVVYADGLAADEELVGGKSNLAGGSWSSQ
jgi:hypothetical protein